MKIVALQTVARELEPGDLFSTVGPDYWSHIDEQKSVGERVYIRTNTPADEFPDADTIVYRILVNKDLTKKNGKEAGS